MNSPSSPHLPLSLDQSCTICLGALSSKRVTTLAVCGHSLHSSCLSHWLESRNSVEEQRCPLCRTSLEALSFFPFGPTAQPTENLLTHYEQPAQLRGLLRENECRLTDISRTLSSAIEEKKDKEFLKDIREERGVLRKRKVHIEELLAVVNRRRREAEEEEKEYFRRLDEEFDRRRWERFPALLQSQPELDEDGMGGRLLEWAREGRSIAILLDHSFLPGSVDYNGLLLIKEQLPSLIIIHHQDSDAMFREFEETRLIVANSSSPLFDEVSLASGLRLLTIFLNWCNAMFVHHALDREYDPNVVIYEVKVEAQSLEETPIIH